MSTERLKHVADLRVSNVDKKSVEGDLPVRLCNYTDVYYNERIAGELDFMTATATPEQRATFGLRAGDVVLTKDSETADDIGMSALIAEDIPDLVCGYHLAVVRARPGVAHGPYLRWVLAGDTARQAMSMAATGVTRFGLRSEAIADLEVPLPPLDEQRAIAHYLDRETARIDALIASKERMVDLLNERLAAAIEDALVGGYTRRVSLRRLLAAPPQYGAAESGSEARYGWPRYVRITDLTPEGALRDDDIRTLPPEVARRYLLSDGDVLLARSGATVGKAFLYSEDMGPACFAGYLIRFSIDARSLIPELFWLWTQTRDYWRQITTAALQATIENVSAEKYKELLVPMPSRDRQQQLLDHLREQVRTVRLVSSRLRNQAKLLTEHRQALITSAVTGQMEVSIAA